MMPAANINRRRAAFEWLTIAIFALLLWLPAADHFLRLDHARPTEENRRPAPPPVYRGIDDLAVFDASFEAYFNDHFGFRKQLIRWSNHWKNELFHDPSAPDVLVGRNGWLYFAGEAMVEHVRRSRRFTHEDMENWRRLIKARQDWCVARGIAYLFVIAPDKQTIYPEYLPDWLDVGPEPSKVDQFMAFLANHPGDLDVVDLSSALRQAAKARQAYWRTDTHWNFFGSFAGYRAMINALTNQIPGLIPLQPDFYDWANDPLPRLGDLAKMLGNDDAIKAETGAYRPIPRPGSPKLDPIYDEARVSRKSSAELKPFFTLNPQARGKAICFLDSFGDYWRKYLGQDFNEVLCIWRFAWDRPLIEREKPNVVIDEMVERTFNIESPLELLRLDISSETNTSPQRSLSQY
jgi:hypothetical protein